MTERHEPVHTSVIKPVGNTALDVVAAAAQVATDPKDALFTGIRLIRAAVAGRFAQQLREEWGQLIEKGKIKPDYANTSQGQTILADMFESLNDANFDDEQIDLLRRLFLAAASETETDRNSLLVREYVAVGRTLSAGEIRVLSAYFQYLPEWQAVPGVASQTYTMIDLIGMVQSRTGLKHRALIERLDLSLGEKGLVRLSGPTYAVDQHLYRFTDYGLAFCQFLGRYENLKKP